jgi:hypothetical protein
MIAGFSPWWSHFDSREIQLIGTGRRAQLPDAWNEFFGSSSG